MRLIVDRNDIKKAVYFISNLTQMQNNRPMQGALSSKGDFMGGIFDRWINIIPEGIIFNKCILPSISCGKQVEVITDYYDYSPKDVGIAPDVIGIRVNGTPVPFVRFNDRWEMVENTPQIEVKTFKDNQYMYSIRNQGYDDKYLIIAISSFDVDYLIPLMDSSLFDDSVYNELHMDDQAFIISNTHGTICQPHKVDYSKTTIGSVELAKIAKSSDFMNCCNLCGAGETPEYIRAIEKKNFKPKCTDTQTPISDVLALRPGFTNLYRFNENWDAIHNTSNKTTLDVVIDNPDSIILRRLNKSNMYIEVSGECIVAGFHLSTGTYCIEFGNLSRDGAKHEEYFMNKSTVIAITDREEELKTQLRNIIQSV